MPVTGAREAGHPWIAFPSFTQCPQRVPSGRWTTLGCSAPPVEVNTAHAGSVPALPRLGDTSGGAESGQSRPRGAHRASLRAGAARCWAPSGVNEPGETAAGRGGRSLFPGAAGALGCAAPGQGSAPRRRGHAGTRSREGRSAPESSDGVGCRAFPTASGAGGVEKINGKGCT